MATNPTPAADVLSEGHRAALAAMLQEEAVSLDSGSGSGEPAIVGRAGERALARANSLRDIASRLTAGQHTSMSVDEMTTVFEVADENLMAAERGGLLRAVQNARDLRSAVEKQEHALRQAEDAAEQSISPEVLEPSMPSTSPGIIEVPVNSRFWPRGFDEVDDAPASLQVLGDPAVLEGDAVVVNMANEPIPPLGLANLGQLAREIAPTDVVVAGDLSSHGDRETVLAAVTAGGRGVLFTGTALTFGGEVSPEVQALVYRGVTVVTFAEAEGAPSSPSTVSKALAAYSTVNVVPSVRMDSASIAQTLHAKEMGRAVAVVPTAMPLDAAPRMSPDLEFPDATIVRSGRELVNLVGPPVETKHEQLLVELRERGFTPAVSRLDVPQKSKNRLFEMAESSADLREFQAKLQYAGSQILPPAEYLHLTSMLDDQGKDLSLAQAHAQARAFGLDTVEQAPPVQDRETAAEQEQKLVGADRDGNPVYEYSDGSLGVYRDGEGIQERIHPDSVTFQTAEWSAVGDRVVPEFGWRVEDLKEAGRLTPDAETHLVRQFQGAASIDEFRDRIQDAPAGVLDPVERRYLVAVLDAASDPGDVVPATWEDCVRAQSAADARVQVQNQQRQEQDRAQLVRPVMAMQP